MVSFLDTLQQWIVKVALQWKTVGSNLLSTSDGCQPTLPEHKNRNIIDKFNNNHPHTKNLMIQLNWLVLEIGTEESSLT